MQFFLILFVLEFISLSFIMLNKILGRKEIEQTLFIITVLAAVQVLTTFPEFINLRSYGVNSFLYRLAFISYGGFCLSSDLLLVLSAEYLLHNSSLNTKQTKIAFYFFWGFTVIEAVIFLSNIFTGFAYTGTLTGQFQSAEASLFFSPISGKWMNCHNFFITIMVLLIFIAMLLKCTTIPLVYAGKYIGIGIYFLIICGAELIQEKFHLNYYGRYVHGLFSAGIPFLLLYSFYFYRPRILLGLIRQMVFDKMTTPVVLFDDEKLLADFNDGAARLFVLEKQLINHLTLSDFLTRSVGNQFREHSTSTVEEVTIKGPAGHDLIFKLDYTKLSDKSGKNYGTLLFFHDITELKKLYNSMEKTAMTDTLTGLSSKAHLEKKVTEINLYRKFPYTAVVCSINGLNLISEGFGEDAAKAATMHVAGLLREQLRASDFAAYNEGNMIVLMPDTSVEAADQVFQRISRFLNKDRTFNFSLSFEYGTAGRPDPDTDMVTTISQAHATMINKKMKSDDEVHQSIIASLRDALRISSFETAQHSARVEEMAVKLAEKLKLPEEEMENLRNLALLHDIGKMSVPADIINKPTFLTDDEKRVMQFHVINGYKIANASKELMPIARGILCHHERWDGTGYPNGYAGENIPYLARIVSVADTFDVMTHDRPYKVALPVEDAIAEIKSNSGKQFDPAVVAAFLSLDFIKNS